MCNGIDPHEGKVQECLKGQRSALSYDCQAELFRQEQEDSEDLRLSIRLFHKCFNDKVQVSCMPCCNALHLTPVLPSFVQDGMAVCFFLCLFHRKFNDDCVALTCLLLVSFNSVPWLILGRIHQLLHLHEVHRANGVLRFIQSSRNLQSVIVGSTHCVCLHNATVDAMSIDVDGL